jgi:hypothetical protein
MGIRRLQIGEAVPLLLEGDPVTYVVDGKPIQARVKRVTDTAVVLDNETDTALWRGFEGTGWTPSWDDPEVRALLTAWALYWSPKPPARLDIIDLG